MSESRCLEVAADLVARDGRRQGRGRKGKEGFEVSKDRS